jgi:CRISPR-associated protein (TIGR03986 family)
MTFRKHIQKVPDRSNLPRDKQPAIAPYNFVELPDRVVSAQLECDGKLRDNDRYYPGRHTGRIECTLTTSSPLYIRCGLTHLDYSKYSKEQKDMTQEEKRQWEEDRRKALAPFFSYSDSSIPVIPGSSLRGMLRTLVEIVSFSKIDRDRVSDREKFFFRAVAADNEDPLKLKYEDKLGKNASKVKAGYLCKQNDGWYIRSAKTVDNTYFVWIQEKIAKSSLPELTLLKNIKDYHPQYFYNVSFGTIITKDNRKIATNVSLDPKSYQYIGTLVTSGNMLEGAPEGTRSNRQYHCLVRHPDSTKDLIKIDDDAIQDYRDSLTAFQKEKPFDPDMGVLKNGRVVFYCQPQKGESVKLFGHSPFFRIPYIPYTKTRASSAFDFIPLSLIDSSIIDIADAIFGWVRKGDKKEIPSQRAGKISISDAQYKESKNGIWYTGNLEDDVTPQILASPKPTTFQHYLVQPVETEAKKEKLKHYASQPVIETVIRGHKLYWHKPENYKFEHSQPDPNSTQQTQIKPIAKDVTFTFTIHFENLTNEELGALLWVLDIAKDEKYRLKLGMGKPLGLGAIKIESELYLSDRKKRYKQLFEGQQWETSELLENNPPYQQVFENYILEQLKQTGKFKDICRIQMLLAMLRWPGPSVEETRYMEIERDKTKGYLGKPAKGSDRTVNEYKERLVLPTPLQVIGIEVQDCLRSSPADSTAPVPPSRPSSDRPQPKPEPPKRSHKFEVGQEVDAIVVEAKSQQKMEKNKYDTTIIYQIEGFEYPAKEEKITKKETDLKKGDTVKVVIKSCNNTGVIKVQQKV